MKEKNTKNKQQPSNSAEKVAQGINDICQGFSLIFAALAEQAAAVADTQKVSAPASTADAESVGNEDGATTYDTPSATDPDYCIPDEVDEMERDEDEPEGTEPAEVESNPEPKEPEKAMPTISYDDLTQVITTKLRKDRKNNEKIVALLKSYGCCKVSELPQEKYEAFVTDISQL